MDSDAHVAGLIQADVGREWSVTRPRSYLGKAAIRKCVRPRPVYSAMADPIVIAHVLSEQGDRLCKAPDTTMSVDLTVEVAARGCWDGTSVVRCGRCDAALRGAPGAPPTRGGNVRFVVAAS